MMEEFVPDRTMAALAETGAPALIDRVRACPGLLVVGVEGVDDLEVPRDVAGDEDGSTEVRREVL